jgi:hypothetical protein
MNSSYFFGNRVGLNKGGRASFNTGGPGFYNEADQKLYEDFQFLPQEQYRLGLGNTTTTEPSDVEQTGIMTQVPSSGIYIPPYESEDFRGGNGDDDDGSPTNAGITSKMGIAGNLLGFMTNPIAFGLTKAFQAFRQNKEDKKTLKDIETNTVPGVRNDPNTVGGSSRDAETGGSFGTSTNEATGARGSGTGFSDYS